MYYWALTAGQCVFYMAICYVSRVVPVLDRLQIDSFRQMFWSVIVESKEWGLGSPTVFDFKYVPEYGVRTTKSQQDVAERKTNAFRTADRRSLVTLLIAASIISLATWTSWRVASLAYGRVVF